MRHFLKIAASLILILLAFIPFHFLKDIQLTTDATGNFALTLGTSASLISGYGLFFFTFSQVFGKSLSSQTTKQELELPRSERWFREISAYLNRGDYVGAEASLEYRIATEAQKYIHHNNPATYVNAMSIGEDAVEAVRLAKQRLGKIPSLGKKFLTAGYSEESTDPRIRNTAEDALRNLVFALRERHDTFKKYFGGKEHEWVQLFSEFYRMREKDKERLYKRYRLEPLGDVFSDLYKLHQELYEDRRTKR